MEEYCIVDEPLKIRFFHLWIVQGHGNSLVYEVGLDGDDAGLSLFKCFEGGSQGLVQCVDGVGIGDAAGRDGGLLAQLWGESFCAQMKRGIMPMANR